MLKINGGLWSFFTRALVSGYSPQALTRTCTTSVRIFRRINRGCFAKFLNQFTNLSFFRASLPCKCRLTWLVFWNSCIRGCGDDHSFAIRIPFLRTTSKTALKIPAAVTVRSRRRDVARFRNILGITTSCARWTFGR